MLARLKALKGSKKAESAESVTLCETREQHQAHRFEERCEAELKELRKVASEEALEGLLAPGALQKQQEQRRIERNRAERDLERAQARRLHTHNRVGEGAWRSRISGVVKPDAPEGPVTYPVTTRRSVTLRWKPPRDNGGADVPETTSLLSHTVRGLESAKQYKFRVFAENVVGLSQPLTGDPVATKDPFNPPGAPSTPAVTGHDSNQVPPRPAMEWDGVPRTGRRSTTNASDPGASAAAASTDPATLEAEVEVQVSVEYYPVSRRSIRSD